jgi:hypothetical protein
MSSILQYFDDVFYIPTYCLLIGTYKTRRIISCQPDYMLKVYLDGPGQLRTGQRDNFL